LYKGDYAHQDFALVVKNTQDLALDTSNMASKLFINQSSEEVKVALIVQRGRDVTATAKTAVFSLEAGQQQEQAYGSKNKPLPYYSKSDQSSLYYADIYLNGILLSWKLQDGSICTQTQETSGVHDTDFGNQLNTNDTVTISSVSCMGISLGSSNISTQTFKHFVNNTGVDIDVILFIQEGKDVTATLTEKSFPLKANSSHNVLYGSDDKDIFLNGISLSWLSGSSKNKSTCTQTREANPNTNFGNQLNTNNTITISSVSCSDIHITNR
jgi:hypothetical protein